MTDLGDMKDRVKSSVTMDDVCNRLGITIPRDRKIRSIYRPEEKTPSMHIYKSDYHDYATGEHGDVIRFAMDHQGWSFPKAVRWLAGQADTGSIRTRASEYVESDVDLTDIWRPKQTLTPGRDWTDYTIAKWGLDPDAIVAMGSIFTTNPFYGSVELWTPHWEEEKVRGIKIRSIDGGKRSYPGSSYRYGLYEPLNVNLPGASAAYLVEGESDAWALGNWLTRPQTDVANVYGLPSGAAMWRDSWRDQLPELVMICLDGDEAGGDATSRITGSLLTAGKTVFHVTLPGGRVAESLIDNSWVFRSQAVVR
jgi:hypothetical protein